MSNYILAIILAAVSSVALPGTAQQTSPKVQSVTIQRTPVESAPEMYVTYCATCHGAKGYGNGPASAALKIHPTDLTTLSQKNGGVFPANHVASVLRFGTENAAHGSKEMPIWSDLFQTLGSANQGAAQTGLRIANLTAYLKQIQK